MPNIIMTEIVRNLLRRADLLLFTMRKVSEHLIVFLKRTRIAEDLKIRLEIDNRTIFPLRRSVGRNVILIVVRQHRMLLLNPSTTCTIC